MCTRLSRVRSLSVVANLASLAAIALDVATPPGVDISSQAWLLDSSGPRGLTAPNALQCTTR